MFVAKFYARLQSWLPVITARKNQQLELALVLSLFLHLTVLIAMATSRGAQAGGGAYAGPTPQAIYAVLTPSAPSEDERVLPFDRLKSEAVTTVAAPINDVLQEKASGKKETEVRKSSENMSAELNAPTQSKTAGLPTVPGYAYGVGLNRQPMLLNDITVEYPVEAGAQEGKLLLRILISETGAMDGLAIIKADPPGVFEDAAVSAFTKAEFSPGRMLGVPVKSQFFVEVDFLPINRENTSGRGY